MKLKKHWGNWFDLLNPSRHDTPKTLRELQERKGLSKEQQPTPKAFRLKFARKTGDGTVVWSIKKHVQMVQAEHKLKKLLARGKTPHPMLYDRSLTPRPSREVQFQGP